MSTKISIVTVTRNSAATIEDTILSVSGQSYQYFEHIIIDGASTDGTLDIINKHIGKFSKLVSEPDAGIYDAMNKGIGLATSDVIGVINFDGFYASPTVLEAVATVFQDSVVLPCWGDLCFVTQHESSKIVRYWRSPSFVPGSFARGCCLPHPTFLSNVRCWRVLALPTWTSR